MKENQVHQNSCIVQECNTTIINRLGGLSLLLPESIQDDLELNKVHKDAEGIHIA